MTDSALTVARALIGLQSANRSLSSMTHLYYQEEEYFEERKQFAHARNKREERRCYNREQIDGHVEEFEAKWGLLVDLLSSLATIKSEIPSGLEPREINQLAREMLLAAENTIIMEADEEGESGA